MRSIILISCGLDQFVQEFNIFPNIHLIVGFPQLIDFTNYLIETQPLVEICYDTTFNGAIYYITFVVSKGLIYEDEPIYPICALIHQNRKLDTHEKFWSFIKKSIGMKENVNILIDREKEIKKAVFNVMFSLDLVDNIVFCLNYIESNVKYLQKQLANAEKSNGLKGGGKELEKIDDQNLGFDNNGMYSKISSEESDEDDQLALN